MRVVLPQTMRAMDKMAIEAFGIPSLSLMENAARQTALEALSMRGDRDGAVLLLAGPGNNGGDALGAARHLLNAGCPVRVALLFQAEHAQGDAATQLDILVKMGLPVIQMTEEVTQEGWDTLFRGCVIAVDGIFGTGLSRAPAGMALAAIEALNRFPGEVLAVDVPSGVDGRTGQTPGIAVRADATVTFGLSKLGLHVYPGAMHTGRVRVADIGMPTGLMPFADDRHEVADRAGVRAWLPQRPPNAHKGTAGTVLQVAGSHGMTGAAVLAAAAALRGGAGFVRCALPNALIPVLSTLVPEAVLLPVASDDGHWPVTAADDILPWLNTADALLVGPGLAVTGETDLLLDRLLQAAGELPVVIDAGALTLLSQGEDIRARLPEHAVLTPHPGEMARLMKCSVAQVLANPVENAVRCAREWQATVVLKGAGTIIASRGGRVVINPTGNAGMATAGAGDALAGLIASLLAQGMDTMGAAVCGAWLHGLSGDLGAQVTGQRALLASDLVAGIGAAYLEVERETEQNG